MLSTRGFVLALMLVVLLACAGAPGPAGLSKTSDAGAPLQKGRARSIQPAPGAVSKPTITYLDQVSPAPKMNVRRAAHTATLLADGKVLIAGGFREEGTTEIAIASAEIYDPATNSFTPTNDMNEPRSGHTATLLPDGKVLIVGGWGPDRRTATAELYDPQTGRFSFTASMVAPRAGMTATLLKNGQVLIAGGESGRNAPQLPAEIYDPALNTFVLTGSLNSGRSAHTATLLEDGRVLMAGGSEGNAVLASAEIYNPMTGKFTLTSEMSAVRYKHAAVLLPDGNVLVMGGSNQNDWNGKYTSAEIYDTRRGVFVKTAGLNSERFKLADAVALLHNGNVLVGGGNRQLELFDPKAQRFILSKKLDNDYYFAALTLLKNGRVLITGGYDPEIQPTDQAWVYH
jgi:WD40 repeat protein